jgi:DNA modification methylase
MSDKPVIEWHGLYAARWNDLLSPSAISHPAKFSHGLIRRIYEYALEQGYIQSGVTLQVSKGLLYYLICQELADLPTGSGEAESINNTTELSGKNLARNLEKKLDVAKSAAQPDFFKSITKSPTDIAIVTQEITWQYYALPVTEKLILLLTEQYPYFSQPGKQAWLRSKEYLTLHIQSPLKENDEITICGDRVLDPFGGVGLGSFYAVNSGLIWLGNELEDKFYKDAYKNFALWCERFWCVCDDHEYLDLLRQYATRPQEESPQVSMFTQAEVNPDDLLEQIKAHALASWNKPNKGNYCPGCGKLVVAYPVLLKGDSRVLSTIIHQQIDGSISSPPYSEGLGHKSNQVRDIDVKKGLVSLAQSRYGYTPAQLGNMPAGDIDALIASPPYIDTDVGGGGGEGPGAAGNALRRSRIKAGNPDENAAKAIGVGYGQADGQLGSLKEGSLDSLISSGPFADSIGSDDPDKRGGLFRDDKRRNDKNLTGSYGASDGQLGTMKDEGFDVSIGSPPFASNLAGGDSDKGILGQQIKDDNQTSGGRFSKSLFGDYGKEDGQLANLPDKGFDLSVSSPSFAGNTGGRGDASRNGIDPALFDRSSGGMKRGTGDSEDNLDHLPMKGFDSAVSSPAYGEGEKGHPSLGSVGQDNWGNEGTNIAGRRGKNGRYGNADNQIANENPVTFWAASKEILLQCYQLLRPGAYSFWVVKRFVKAGVVVEFDLQWLKLCEVCGFEHIETIIAWQTEDKGTNYDFEGEKQKKVVRRQSFFRLLHIKKHPELAIDCEIILVMRKNGK